METYRQKEYGDLHKRIVETITVKLVENIRDFQKDYSEVDFGLEKNELSSWKRKVAVVSFSKR